MDFQLPWEKGLGSLGKSFRDGSQTVQGVATKCLERIALTDDHLRAWTELQPGRVQAEAERLDQLLHAGIDLGPLHGVPVGVKDIIDVQGYASSAGYEPWKQSVARQDAEVIARLRAQGALILGKTATCAFASFDPAPSRHPRFAEKTPGGSSAGSAVAVAAGHCPLALGSQTGGSILRPAAYCGIVGFKPTHGLVPTAGAVPLAPTLDHVGLMSATPDGLDSAFAAISGSPFPEPDHGGNAVACSFLVWPEVEAVLGSAGPEWNRAVEKLINLGLSIRRQSPPEALPLWLEAHRKIMAREAFAWHSSLEPDWKAKYPPKVSGLLSFGESLKGKEITEAYRARREARQFFFRELGNHEILSLPTIHAGIPDRDNTGDYRYQGLASFVGFPALGLPWNHRSGFSKGLFGESVQFVGRPNTDAQLLSVAKWLFH